MKVKLVEHSLIAFAIFLCTFFCWIFIAQGDLFGDGDLGPWEPGLGDEGKGNIYYFTNTEDTSPENANNYWLDEGLSEPAEKLPDLTSDEYHIMSEAQFDGEAILTRQSSNQGTINGNATFVGDLSENYGTITGTRTRLYNNDNLEITRDFTGADAPWTVTADSVYVDVTHAIYDGNTTFTRLNGGYFISDMTATEASIEGRTLTITYDRELNGESVPATENYGVTVGGEPVGVSEVSVSGSSVILEIDSSVVTDVAVLLSYEMGDNQVLSMQGLNGLSFEDMAVTVILPEPEEEEEPEDNPGDEEEEQVEFDAAPVEVRSGGSLPLSFLTTPQASSKKTITKESVKTDATANVSAEGTVSEKTSETSSSPASTVEVKSPSTTTTPVSPVAEKLDGKVLLSVEDKGRIWYVAPTQHTRYEVTTGNALNLFRNTSLGITNKDLEKIPVAGTTATVTPTAKRLTGRFLLQVENKGQTWYVDPSGYRHKVGIQNVVEVTKQSALGITNKDLGQIAPGN